MPTNILQCITNSSLYLDYLSNTLNSNMNKHADKVKQLATMTFKCPRADNCPTHNLPQELVCLDKKCKNYMIPMCADCQHHHPLLSVKKIVPMLAKWVGETWQDIRSENIQIESEWKICLVNINYCFDILAEVKKMIQGRNVYELPGFQQILDLTTQMMDERNRSLDSILKNVELLNSKYHLWDGPKLDGDYVGREREFRKQKWHTMGTKTKGFSEKALAFSETLAQTIQDRLKYQRRVKHLQSLANTRIANLKDLLNKNVEEVSNLKIQFSDKRKEDEEDQKGSIEKYLQMCENLQSIQINNRNGKIQSRAWDTITTKLEYLKKLRQLKLNIRSEDLKILTKLFKQKPNSVRYIQVLHLTINDDPKLDPKDVAEFCNTLQLREAHLTLCRDNITKIGFKEMLKSMRVHTSLTKLPMKELNINVSKNKIVDQKDIFECEGEFRNKCAEIKSKSLNI